MSSIRRAVLALTAAVATSLTIPEPISSQDPRTIENLRAFAKLYGYVKYFHPSDAAFETDWDSFAVYGAERVMGASDTEELRGVLEDLFLPLAPTVQLYAVGEPPPPPIETPADTAGLLLVAWQHQGLGVGTQSPVYSSIRLNRRNRMSAGSNAPGIVTQAVDATSLRGKQIKLSAFVRTAVSGGGNQAQLWLRVDRADQQLGFFDNMDDPPITAAEWQQYEIVGDVADDASRIVFGCFLLGSGAAWFDEYQISVRGEGGAWEPVEITNPGFEQAAESGGPAGWRSGSQGYEYVLETEGAHSGSQSLVVRDRVDWFAGQMFEGRPGLGETVEREIGAGLMARVPLALLSDSSGMVVPSDDEKRRELRREIAAVASARATVDEVSVRVAGVVITWNVFQHFYPYFDVIDTDWDEELTTALRQALEDESAQDFYRTMNRLVATLHDGHGRVIHQALSPGMRIPARLEWVERQVVVTASADTGVLQRGDVIVSVDGVPAEETLLERERYISGSPQWRRYRSLMELGASRDSAPADLVIERDGATLEVAVARSGNVQLTEFARPNVSEIEAGIYYVNLDNAEMAEIAEHMAEIAQATGVVFDLRGYPNGNHGVISHLLERPDTSDSWMHVAQMIYPDQEDIVGWRSAGWNLPALEPHIEGMVAFITDGRAISYAESFMGFIEHYRLGEIVGQPTAGANGNVNPFGLPGGFRVTWTGMKVTKHDGSQHHLVGIQPTIPMERTIQGIREGRDELLERALEVVRGAGSGEQGAGSRETPS
ncbi:MAG: peptidase S41 [Gemmatimonadota bacterium]|nr:MAG: peptidase S41 [Gemmatimonadota bacterium]